MEPKVGNIYKYKDRVVILASIRNDIYILTDFFTPRAIYAKLEDLSYLDIDVAKFTSLIMIAPQLTHDEIKAQIQFLFR